MSKIEELQTKIDELQKELDELKKQEKGRRWRPEAWEIYYCVDTDGGVIYTKNAGTTVDKGRMAIGNKFKTEEECEFVAEKLKVMEELRQFAEPEDREWDNENKHWFLFYKHDYCCIELDYKTSWKHNDIYFESVRIARKAIKTVGEERIKKYYLGVK